MSWACDCVIDAVVNGASISHRRRIAGLRVLRAKRKLRTKMLKLFASADHALRLYPPASEVIVIMNPWASTNLAALPS
jgi:hypothetical protein